MAAKRESRDERLNPVDEIKKLYVKVDKSIDELIEKERAGGTVDYSHALSNRISVATQLFETFNRVRNGS